MGSRDAGRRDDVRLGPPRGAARRGAEWRRDALRARIVPAVARLAWGVLTVAVLLAACGDGGSTSDGGAAPAAGTGGTPGGAPGAATAAPAGRAGTAAVERAVRVVQVQEGALTTTRRAAATVRADRESRVAAGASGRVAEMAAREGSTVAAGDVLVRLDDAQPRRALDNAELAVAQARIQLERARHAQDEGVAQARAAARAAEASLELAVRQLDEAEALLAIGAVAASDVQALRAQRDQAASAAVQARDAVARAGRGADEELALLELQLRQAEVQEAQAREALADAVVRAPFEGEVAELFVEVGEFVGAGSAVARLLGTGPQLVSFTVPPEDAPLLEAAGRVVLASGGRELEATVERVERQAQQTRLATVTARLSDDAARLPSGGVGEVHYDVALGRGLLVPSGALTADAGRTYVFVVRDEAGGAVAVRTEVRVVSETGNQAIVEGVAAGALVAGTPVVSPRPLDVRDGTPVRVVEMAPTVAAP